MGTGSKVAAVLLLLFAVGRARAAPAAPAPARPRPKPRGGPTTVTRTLTGGGASWLDERKDELRRRGFTGDVALSILAMWAFETANGGAEWNFNVGNIKAVGTQPRVDLGSAGMFRAFESLDDGVTAWLGFVQQPRFAPCFQSLNADPTSDAWIRCLGRAKYYEVSADTYAAGWRSRREQLAKSFGAVHGDFFGFMNALRPNAK